LIGCAQGTKIWHPAVAKIAERNRKTPAQVGFLAGAVFCDWRAVAVLTSSLAALASSLHSRWLSATVMLLGRAL
jgi:hypothetical protein